MLFLKFVILLLPARPVLRNVNHNLKLKCRKTYFMALSFVQLFRLGKVHLRKSYQINCISFFDVTTRTS